MRNLKKSLLQNMFSQDIKLPILLDSGTLLETFEARKNDKRQN